MSKAIAFSGFSVAVKMAIVVLEDALIVVVVVVVVVVVRGVAENVILPKCGHDNSKNSNNSNNGHTSFHCGCCGKYSTVR